MNKPLKPNDYYFSTHKESVRTAADFIKIMENIVKETKEEISPEDIEFQNNGYGCRPVIVWYEKVPDPAYYINIVKYNAEMLLYKRALKQLLEDAEKE